MGMKAANLALSLFLPQVAAPCIPPSSHELVVSDSPFPTLPAPPPLSSASWLQLTLDPSMLVEGTGQLGKEEEGDTSQGGWSWTGRK